jgi:predicted dehydrogenase
MRRISRRAFVKGSLYAAAAATLSPYSHASGANDDIRIAVVGLGSFVKIGGKGRQDLRAFRKIPGVRIAAICDCDSNHVTPVFKECRDSGEKVMVFKDVRDLLDNKDIDAVSITTPNHWHSLMAIWACQAGKDVFVQKPASHNIFEGRQMVEAARRYGRVVQAVHGPRSNGALEASFEYARQGELGRIKYVHGVNYKPRMSIGKVDGPQPIPESCDYDLWCGPAPKKPMMRKNLHYDWHWDWSTGNGDLGNMGIHYMDSCRWALNERRLPERVISIGGRFGYDDDGQTPNTLITLLDYEPAPILFEVRGLPRNMSLHKENWGRNMDKYHGVQYAAVVHCEDGYVLDGTAYDKKGNVIKKFRSDRPDAKVNFINVMRSRKTEDLFTSAIEGHLSCGLVHMTNISYRTGTEAPNEQIREVIRSSRELSSSFDRFLGHLDANGIDLAKTPAVLGPMLRLDSDTEKFVGPFSEEANMLVSRDYRKPFVVPKKV